ncbi:hypothetical protein [Candidatus Spyradosoma sp. SGI.093]|uniref:hypothetical protein n=1 Tax=Candidatus Spyradosoma sp. SGI.093 TaxID=3420583 RepID=UPI003D0315D1
MNGGEQVFEKNPLQARAALKMRFLGRKIFRPDFQARTFGKLSTIPCEDSVHKNTLRKGRSDRSLEASPERGFSFAKPRRKSLNHMNISPFSPLFISISGNSGDAFPVRTFPRVPAARARREARPSTVGLRG